LVKCLLINGLESPLEGNNRDLIKALSCYFSGITKENYENPDPG
jgi:hypothetical protein